MKNAFNAPKHKIDEWWKSEEDNPIRPPWPCEWSDDQRAQMGFAKQTQEPEEPERDKAQQDANADPKEEEQQSGDKQSPDGVEVERKISEDGQSGHEHGTDEEDKQLRDCL